MSATSCILLQQWRSAYSMRHIQAHALGLWLVAIQPDSAFHPSVVGKWVVVYTFKGLRKRRHYNGCVLMYGSEDSACSGWPVGLRHRDSLGYKIGSVTSGSVTITTLSSSDSATTLSRMNFSGYVWYATIFSWVCYCVLFSSRISVWLVNCFAHVFVLL